MFISVQRMKLLSLFNDELNVHIIKLVHKCLVRVIAQYKFALRSRKGGYNGLPPTPVHLLHIKFHHYQRKRTIFIHVCGRRPVSMAARSKASTVFGRSNIGIAGSNTARGIRTSLWDKRIHGNGG
jgi:hypothetical protein